MECGSPCTTLRFLVVVSLLVLGVGSVGVESYMGVAGALVRGNRMTMVKENKTGVDEKPGLDKQGAATEEYQDSQALLMALLRLEKALSGTRGCDTRLQDLWRDITIQRVALKGLEHDIFRKMDLYAKVQLKDPSAVECPEPFEVAGGGCFYHPHGVKKTWSAARFSCARLGGDLAYPTNISKFRKYVKTISSGGWGFFFLGGKADPKQDFPVYQWIDGRKIVSEREQMASELIAFGSDYCVVMEAYNWFEIKPKNCETSRRWYICEIKVKNMS
ncbi:uncharacterized protein [Procambarus clarkii]|uniref:uncharacterized protein n=1 Tax=Procambarus clarkii TaxID=6728 RepID=UPI001E673194|nr:uncharacterized protein LOC123768711 [Procambarus clarkii]